MRHTKRVSRLKKFSSLIDVTSELLTSAEELSPGSIERMRQFVEPYRRIVERVRKQEKNRVGEEIYVRANAPEIATEEQAAE